MNTKKGSIVTIVLIFGLVFLILIGGLLSFILVQMRYGAKRLAWEQALHTAEAGVNYYRWCLNNGAEEECVLNKQYLGPKGNYVGDFSIEVIPTVSCGETVQRQISVDGWTDNFPDTSRQVRILYARTSVAKYAYLINDNVWAGSDRILRGLYHSNGGIRMDGENQSLVTSALPEWVCTDSFGCDSCPASAGCVFQSGDCVCPGIFTTTSNADPDLFDYPISYFDFDGITIDLAQIKQNAISSSIYFPPSTDINSQADGYHLKFNSDGTVEVWIITRLWSDWGYSTEEDWHYDYFRIRDEYFYASYLISSDCPVVFVEDNLWPEGTISGKVTVAAANLIDPNLEVNIVLSENITYASGDGSDGLALVGEGNILISPDSPNEMELRGIYIAQKGHFGRNHYNSNFRDLLEIYGSVVSNGRVGTQWTSGSYPVSGYLERQNYVDPDLLYAPPSFVPYTSHDFKIVKWEEVE